MSTVETLVGRIGWHELVTPDVETAQKFYGELLGWEYEIFQPGEMSYPMIKSGGQNHGGFLSSEQLGPGVSPHWLAYVIVGNADETAKQAKGAGGEIVHGPMQIPDVGTILIVKDPQGAVISAISPSGEEGAPAQGVFVWDELATSDVESAKGFYETLFGWTAEDTDMAGMGTYTIFQKGEQQIAGAMHSMPGDPSPPHWTTYIGADDVDATADKVRGLGGTIHVEPTDIPGIGRFAIIADPTGAVVGLYKSAT
jgi:predicted enzyme related to lactoylglutathione lyase